VWLAAGGATPYIGGAAHGARLLTPRPTTLGFPDVMGRDVRSWSHRPVLPTVGGYLRWQKLQASWATTPDVYFYKILVRLIIFRKS
jgi:hypothetical protein